MKLLCDEDVGTGVPSALDAVNLAGQSLRKLGMGGRPDVEWLEFAGREGWVVFSYNREMLRVPEEIAAIHDHKVGIVFATAQMAPAAALLVLLRRWHDLERLDSTQPRPFVRFIDKRAVLRFAYRDYPSL